MKGSDFFEEIAPEILKFPVRSFRKLRARAVSTGGAA
jgi:hypothetical protein